MKTTTNHLPSLRYLRKGRLRWAIVTVTVFYGWYFAFAASSVYSFLKYRGYYYTDEVFIPVFGLFILAGVGVVLHVRRLVLAMSTKWQALRGGIVVPNYDTTITPIEAAVLIDARNEGELGYLLLDDAQAAGTLNVWRHNGKLHVQDTEADAKLAYYTQLFTAHLFAYSRKVEMTDRALRRSEAVKQAEEAIYQRMVKDGYLAKMNWFQEFVREYAVVCQVLLSGPAYIIVGIFMTFQLIAQSLMTPTDIIPSTDSTQMILAVTGAAALIVAPLIMSLVGAYSIKGSQAFREVFGIYWFLRVAYGTRFAHRDFMSKDDQVKYMPYAKAFGIVDARAA